MIGLMILLESALFPTGISIAQSKVNGCDRTCPGESRSTHMIFAILCGLAGIALGQRFRVLVLLPAGGAVLTTAYAVAGAGPFVTMVLLAAAGIASLQIGYLIGIVIRPSLTGASTNADTVTGSTKERPAL
jgi:hypothetical protein